MDLIRVAAAAYVAGVVCVAVGAWAFDWRLGLIVVGFAFLYPSLTLGDS